MKRNPILIMSILILVILLIGGTTIFILNKNPKNIASPKYSEKATNAMKEYNIYDKVYKENYSKTVEIMLEKGLYKDEYFKEYLNIVYKEDVENFVFDINKLLLKGYNAKEINLIFNNFLEQLDIILNMDHFNILDFENISNFHIENLDRYLSYQQANKEYELKTVVTYVNIGLDLKGYSDYSTYTSDEAASDLTILVNKFHKLPDEYEPSDLVNIGSTNYQLRKEAADAYEKLNSAALLDNVNITPFSAYRSFATQNGLYIMYKRRDGEEIADTYSARPGFSEHQLGLAVDVRSSTLKDNLTTYDYNWMLNNSYKYGFIIRYPKGKQYITGFMEEPWHIRYLGIDLATKVHDSELTYDEYYDLYLNGKLG